MIIIWAALTGILVVENMVLGYYGYVIMWYTSAWLLSLVSVWVGVMIGYGIKWSLWTKRTDSDENYDF